MRNLTNEMKVERGIRLSVVLKETHTRGKDLGDVIGRKLTPQTVSAMLHGRAPVTPKTAELIHAKWPVYSISWLLGEGPRGCRNEAERERARKHQFVSDYADVYDGIELIAKACNLIVIPRGEGGVMVCSDDRDGKALLSDDEWFGLMDEIRDFVDFKLGRLFKGRN